MIYHLCYENVTPSFQNISKAWISMRGIILSNKIIFSQTIMFPEHSQEPNGCPHQRYSIQPGIIWLVLFTYYKCYLR